MYIVLRKSFDFRTARSEAPRCQGAPSLESQCEVLFCEGQGIIIIIIICITIIIIITIISLIALYIYIYREREIYI